MHISVLKNEAIKYLSIKRDGIYLDLTGGRGGHSKEILNNLSSKGKLIIFDQDEFAYNNLVNVFSKNKNVYIFNDNFKNFDHYLKELNIPKVDGILFDLGVSSDQIDDASRGFSYLLDNTLDMRMSKKIKHTAKDIINSLEKNELANIFYKYGEEKNSFKIANEIIKRRPINTSGELVKICDMFNKSKGHSAKKVFQALRIYVNDELGSLELMLEKALAHLNINGVIVSIAFHSLEDRIVKLKFKSVTNINIDKFSPVKIEEDPDFLLLTKKGIKATAEEINSNKRSKSAILRAIKKVK